jgi:GNAT superfamily N-acetyltransferase
MQAHHIVRLADRPDAIEVVARWHFEEWGSGAEERGLEEGRRSMSSRATERGIPCAYVAVVEEDVCGSASLVDHDMSDPPVGTEDLRPWLSGVYVRTESRNMRLGSALVKAVEDAASALGHPYLYLYTAPSTAAKFYAPLGWEELLSPTYEGKLVVVMQKALHKRSAR